MTGERSRALLPAAIALVTGAVFAASVGNGFVWEDEFNLVDNPRYRGLGTPQLWWMLTVIWSEHAGLAGQWIPLTWATFGFDYLVWRMDPAGYHLTNVVLHVLNAVLFYHLAGRLFAAARPAGARDAALAAGAATAALFFAIHPLRVESVAWITERRDVLSGLLFLLTVLAYLEAARRQGSRRRRWLAGSAGAYALALSAKPIVVALPLVLLVLDAYPLRRLRGEWRPRLVEKVPYAVLAAGAAAITLYAGRGAATLHLGTRPLEECVAMAFWSVARYVHTTVLPLDLSPLYEAPVRVDPGSAPYAISALVVIGITLALVVMRRRWPAALAAWAACLLLVAPVSGIIPVGPHQGADRYTYLPSLAASLLLGGAVIAVVRAGAAGTIAPRYVRLALLAVAVWLGGLGFLTHAQIGVWRSHETLWRWAVEVDPSCGRCHGNLGEAYRLQHRFDLAITHLERAVSLRPDVAVFHRDLGFARLQSGRAAEAVVPLREAVARLPRDVDVQNFTGLALTRVGAHAEAIPYFEAAIRLGPDRADLRVNLGAAFASIGRMDDAREHARRAQALDPREIRAQHLLDAIGPATRP